MTDISLEYPPWRDLLMVCRKCTGKRDNGFGPDGDMTLREALRQHIRKHELKGVLRAVETDCLDLCPEDGVSCMRLSDPGHIAVVPLGTPVCDVLLRFGLDPDETRAA
jgi:hypothetical protein